MEAPLTAQMRHIKLAQALPPRLVKFFLINRPRSATATLPARPRSIAPTSTTTSAISPLSDTFAAETSRSSYMNPFQPHKNPKTGRWHPPIYSLRQQADLVKIAKKHNVEDLLPYTVKGTEERARQRELHGLRVKGTGVGQRVKGHEWERTMKGRLEKRRKAMLDMPRMVQEWKQRGHGRGNTKWPSGKSSR